MSRCFRDFGYDDRLYTKLMTDMQRLRGRVYVEDGALDKSQLTDGRHILASDASSWHLLWLHNDRVAGCMRYRVHPSTVPYQQLSVAHSTQARCGKLGPRVRAAVERELSQANRQGVGFGEAGGWALDHELRGSTAALRIVLATYSLAQLLGDAIVLSTATTRNNSASILCRIGGSPLHLDDGELETYYDHQYRCDMLLLRFDSRVTHAKYAAAVTQQRLSLQNADVICAPKAFAASAAA
jgi:hypothetical protein